MRYVVRVIAAFLLVVAGVWAQSTAQISGSVQDASGLAVSGADVRATQTETSLERTVTTDVEGRYVLPNLPVGHYQLQVGKTGFSAYTASGITLEVNANPVYNVTLNIGTVTEQVEVQASAAMVETHSNSVGQVIDNQRVLELPLNGRQATELIYLSGGATPAPAADLNTNKNFPTTTISIAGGQANGSTYMLDGGTHNDPLNNLNFPLPFPDALQEFKVETSATPARYGHHSAGAVNVVTKSGSNSFHGDAFEFVRNYDFNARNFFQPVRDSLKRNQFGGVIGGPIMKNKMFFFGGVQRTLNRQVPTSATVFVPTAAMLAGDFTAFTSAACNSGKALALKGPYVNNQIDPKLFDPVSVNLLKYIPVSSDPCGKIAVGTPNNSNQTDAVVKIDYQISAGHSIFGRYLPAQYSNPAFYDGKNALTLTKAGYTNRVQSFVLGDTYMIGGAIVSSLHLTVNRAYNKRVVPEYFSPTDLGAKVYSAWPKYTNLTVTGAFGTGGGTTNPGQYNTTTYQVAEDIDVVRGSHQFAFGVNYIQPGQNESNQQFSNGSYSFSGQMSGSAIADFMVGAISGDQQGNAQRDNERGRYLGIYFQDSWRLSSRFTVNAGIRWEPFMPMRHKFGWVSHFDQASFLAGKKSTIYTNAPAGLMYPGDAGYPGTAFTFGSNKDFAPRLGLVWDPAGDGKTSVRASYGMFYDLPHFFFNVRTSNAPPWGASVNSINLLTPYGLSNPWANYPGGNPFPSILSGGKNQTFPLSGIFINYSNLHTHAPVLHQWNLSIQRQVSTWLFTASYLGNRGVHQWTAYEGNPGVYAPGATASNINTRRVLYRADPVNGQYFGTIATLDDGGRTSYNAMLLSAQRRLTGFFSVLANWTWSHCLSDGITTELAGPSRVQPNDRNAEYGSCGTSDRRHVINLSSVISVPKITGNPWLSRLAGGWQLSVLARPQTGAFASVTTGTDVALSGIGNQRPHQIAASPYDPNPTVDHYLVKSAFQVADTGTYGSLGVNTIKSPGSFQLDTSLSRTFRLTESQKLDFRAEAFNVPNRMNANAPVTALNNANFGKIQTATDPRIMQFAVKWTF